MIVIANVFSKLQTVKDMAKNHSWKPCFRTSLNSQHVNRWQTLAKTASEQFYPIFWSTWEEIISKLSPLFKFENLGVFFNTLTADDKYPVPDSLNLQFPIQIQWSWKQKTFSQVFGPFMESLSNFNEFRKKDDHGS